MNRTHSDDEDEQDKGADETNPYLDQIKKKKTKKSKRKQGGEINESLISRNSSTSSSRGRASSDVSDESRGSLDNRSNII